MSRSHLEVKGQNEYYLIGLYLVRLTFQPCIIGFQRNLAQTFTMLRRRVTHKTQACTTNVKVTLRGQNENCLIWLYLVLPTSIMHHRIPKLLGTHVYHDEVTCGTQDTGLYLKGQGQTWRSNIEMRNHASQNSQVTGHTCSPWWGDMWRTRQRPVTGRFRSHLQVKGRIEKCLIGLYPKCLQCIAVFVNKCTYNTQCAILVRYGTFVLLAIQH